MDEVVSGCLAGDTVSELFGVHGTLSQHGYHSILQRYAIPSSSQLVPVSFVFQLDNDPKHTSRLCKGYLTKKESDGVQHQVTWPPQSPNLNPVGQQSEGKVANKYSAYSFETVGKAFQVKLVRECKVCRAVIKAKGGYFEEYEIY